LTPPPAGLLALKDPYDPQANAAYRLAGLHDLSLYHGRLYMYWGPTPVVTLYLPWRILPFGHMPEALAVVIYAFTGLVMSLLLLRFLVRRYLPGTPGWMRLAGVVALAFDNVAPFLLRRPTVYEVAIAAGSCFATAGLYFLFTGTLRERLSLTRLALGSLCMGLAVGARPPQLLAGATTLVLLVFLIRAGTLADRRERLRAAAALLGPIAVCGVLLLIYNRMRFDSFTEFGQKYQLAGDEISKKNMFDFAYIPPGLYFYLLAPVRWALSFPYAHLPPPPGYPGSIPAGYTGMEPTAGLLSNMPFLLMLGALPALARKGRAPRGLVAIVAGLTGLALAIAAFVSWTLWGATMRYEMDFASLLVIAALLIWFTLHGQVGARRWPRRLVTVLGAAAITYGVVVAAAISTAGYDGSLELEHPGTFRALSHFFSPLPTLATMISGHAGISAIQSDPGVALPHANYGTSDVSGASFAIGPAPSTVTVIAPRSEQITLRASLEPEPGLPSGARALVQASSHGSQASSALGAGTSRWRVKVRTGLNDISFRVSSAPALPPSLVPTSQVVLVRGITIEK
jgi:hypothetical protein